MVDFMIAIAIIHGNLEATDKWAVAIAWKQPEPFMNCSRKNICHQKTFTFISHIIEFVCTVYVTMTVSIAQAPLFSKEKNMD